jgi:hypothetical protein
MSRNPYTAFSGEDALSVRLVVRRVRLTPGSQQVLFTTWDYHAFVTNRPGEMVEVEAGHRRHAVVEQRIAERRIGGLADLPSSPFLAHAIEQALQRIRAIPLRC